jgi:hypothetical protein
MRRSKLIFAGFAALAAGILAAPALAEYGAFALEEATGKHGMSWNEANQRQADEAAIRSCNASGCKVVFRVGAKECGAIATTDEGKVWGGARRPTRAAAELAAIQNCQKHTKLQCKVRGAECNR